jgi:MFS family permease
MHWKWVMHVGHVLIGLAGIPLMVMPSMVSAVWFPVDQRSFATAFTANSQGFGTGIGFVLIAFFTEQYGVRTMLYIQAEFGLFVALLATIYFPPSPPTAPSPSAQEERSSFLQSMKMLLKNRNFILLAVSGGTITGAVL